MKKIYLILFLFLFCSSILIAQNTVIIQVSNFVFTPKFVTVNTGDIVRFQWVSGGHPSVSDDDVTMPVFPMNSGAQQKDFVFTSPQVIPYYCQPHGDKGGIGMAGVITVVQKPVGLQSVKFLPNLKVYPNPSSGRFNASVSFKNNAILSVKLIDLLGKEAADLGTMELSAGQHILNFDIDPSLRRGLYFVKFKEGNNVALSRLSIE